jgi:predicted ATPase
LDSDSIINAVKSNFQSHGEVLKHYTIDAIFKAKDCVIILDEPESGLSITNQYNLIHEIWRSIKLNRCQFFIATHCYPLIDAFDVISLEHSRYLSGSNFIEKVRYSD